MALQHKKSWANVLLSRSAGNSAIDLNVALVGGLGVGKTAIVVKYITKRYIVEYDPFLEMTQTKQETFDQQDVVLNIFDTYDEYEPASHNGEADRYLKWADAFIVVYDITDRMSYNRAKLYLDLIKAAETERSTDAIIILTGNKSDLERYRQINKKEAEELASQYDATFFECSAAERYNSVKCIFHSIIKEMMPTLSISVNSNEDLLQPLFISEDKQTASTSNSIRDTKSPSKNRPYTVQETSRSSTKTNEDKKNSQQQSGFKLFNKGFKIFN